MGVLFKVINYGVDRLKISFTQALCNFGPYCRKNTKLKAQRRMVEHFESALDIRQLVERNLNLNQLLNILLTP